MRSYFQFIFRKKLRRISGCWKESTWRSLFSKVFDFLDPSREDYKIKSYMQRKLSHHYLIKDVLE